MLQAMCVIRQCQHCLKISGNVDITWFTRALSTLPKIFRKCWHCLKFWKIFTTDCLKHYTDCLHRLPENYTHCLITLPENLTLDTLFEHLVCNIIIIIHKICQSYLFSSMSHCLRRQLSSRVHHKPFSGDLNNYLKHLSSIF